MVFHRNRLIVAISTVLVLMGLACVLVLRSVQGSPYRMTLKPSDGRAVVQFEQPDRNLLSDEFEIELKLETPRTFELRSGTIPFPDVTVEFHDTTLLPGRFRLRVGNTVFDVMQRAVIIDGHEHKWHRSDGVP